MHSDEVRDGCATSGRLAMLVAGLASAAAAAGMAGLEPMPPQRLLAVAVAGVMATLAIGHVPRRLLAGRVDDIRGRVLWTSGAVGVALLVELLVRGAVGIRLPLEAVILVLFRNAVVALAALQPQRTAIRGAVVLAAFLVVFTSASAATPWMATIVITFALVATAWLILSHWESLERPLAEDGGVAPRSWLVAGPLGMLGLLVILPVSHRQLRALDGFMPTSGGRHDASDLATSGVGDGDALVAGLDDIRSFAPIEDAPFSTSHEPSLYDLFDDTYSEPAQRKDHERAVSLPPQVEIRREDPSMANSSRAGREFSTVRRERTESGSRIRDLDSEALLYVKGRAPAHLVLETFDVYDGVNWLPEPRPDPQPEISFDLVAGRPWLRLDRPTITEFHATPDVHTLKIVRLDINRIPVPHEFLGLHIDQVARADMFRVEQPDVIAMARSRLPDMLVVHVQSRQVDPGRFHVAAPSFGGGDPVYRFFGDDPESQAVRALAASWVEGLPRGWRQIDRVVTRIREGFLLDRDAVASADTRHSVADFLLETRRGADYQFASAAAWCLRSLGYSTRLVAGLYVDPRRYDARADHTPVMPSDVHVWLEVLVSPGHWMTLEPSPGYETAGPPPGILSILARPLVWAARVVDRHPFAAAAVAILGACLAWWWRPLVDRIDGWLCAALPSRGPRADVLRVLGRLERRCRRAGLPRPRHMTPQAWLREVERRTSCTETVDHRLAGAFRGLADRALYAPRFEPEGVDPICRSADTIWSWRRVRAVARHGRGLNV